MTAEHDPKYKPQREYYQRNKESINQQRKEYRLWNKARIAEYNREYYYRDKQEK